MTKDLCWDNNIHYPYAAPQLNDLFGLSPHSASGLLALRFMRGFPLLSLRDMIFMNPRTNSHMIDIDISEQQAEQLEYFRYG
jgi:hypothetical protein